MSGAMQQPNPVEIQIVVAEEAHMFFLHPSLAPLFTVATKPTEDEEE